MRNLVERIEKVWCTAMHGSPMWPIHGRYRCSTCLREYSVAFEGHPQDPEPSTVVWTSAEPIAAKQLVS